MSKEPKVLIAIPTAGGLHERTSMWMTEVCRQKENLDRFVPGTFRGRPVDHVRNVICRLVLKRDYTHVLFIDSDIELPLDAVDLMLATQRQITESTGRPVMVTGCYPILLQSGLNWVMSDRGQDGHYHCFKRHHDQAHPYRVDASGGGCLLVPREILAVVDPAWFLWIERPDGTQMSEDIYFFDKMNRLGFYTWADPSVLCKHYKEIELLSLTELIEREVEQRVQEIIKQQD
jgi:hypothetical protein